MGLEPVTLLLACLSLILSVGSLSIAVVMYRKAQAVNAQRELQIVQLEKQIAVTTKGSIGLGQRLLALEHQLRTVLGKQEELQSGDTFAYGQAMQMLKQGADTATVASNCGFSNSEAELMALVQKQLAGRPRTSRDDDV